MDFLGDGLFASVLALATALPSPATSSLGASAAVVASPKARRSGSVFSFCFAVFFNFFLGGLGLGFSFSFLGLGSFFFSSGGLADPRPSPNPAASAAPKLATRSSSGRRPDLRIATGLTFAHWAAAPASWATRASSASCATPRVRLDSCHKAKSRLRPDHQKRRS
jgi:hypothetical protein